MGLGVTFFSQGMGERDSVGQFVSLHSRGTSGWQPEGRGSGGRGSPTPSLGQGRGTRVLRRWKGREEGREEGGRGRLREQLRANPFIPDVTSER